MNNTEINDITSEAKERRSVRLLMLVLSGILTGLCLVISKIGFLEWLTLVPCALFLLTLASKDGLRLRALYGYGVFFFMSFYTVNFHWFVNLYPLDFIDGMTKGAALCVVIAAWIGLSFFQAVQGGLVFVLTGIVFRTSVCRRFSIIKPFAFAGIWAVYEWLQTFGWWGVPWGRLPLGQSEYLVGLQTASWFGPYFVTFIIVSVNALIALALSNKSKLKLCGVVVAALLVFQYGAGTAIWLSHKNTGETVRVAAVQGNISSHEKWDSSSSLKTRQVYEGYTKEAASRGAKIVVWPETALPYTISKGSSYYKFASELAQENNVTILVGAFTVDGEGYYNSLICFTPDGKTLDNIYAKRRLVPFGEFVPMRTLIETVIPPLAELVMSGDEITQGEDSKLFMIDEGAIGSLICFDSIYEDLTRRSVLDGAQLICLSTNDSWFTDSAALYMHNAQAQLRAIESGRDIVRSANTGISTVINSRGEVVSELAPLVDGLIVEDVCTRSNTTLYTRIGNLFVYLLALAIVSVIATDVCLRFSKKVKKQ
jgi:apolipoprotein N-acyltransferase